MTTSVSDAAQIKIVQLIAKELGVKPKQVASAVALLDEGATVPFIARYRKEITDNLDDTHLRTLEERLLYLREMEERRLDELLDKVQRLGKQSLSAEEERFLNRVSTRYRNNRS